MISLVIAWIVLLSFVSGIAYGAWQDDEGRLWLISLAVAGAVVWALITLAKHYAAS